MESQKVTNQMEKYSVYFPTLSKMKGAGASPLKINVKDAMTGLVGGFFTISVLAMLTGSTSTEWLMAPFGASCSSIRGLECTIIAAEKHHWRTFDFNVCRFGCIPYVGKWLMGNWFGRRTRYCCIDADKNYTSACRRKPSCCDDGGIRLEFFIFTCINWFYYRSCLCANYK